MSTRKKSPVLRPPESSVCGNCSSVVLLDKWDRISVDGVPGYAMISNAKCKCGHSLLNGCVFKGFPIEPLREWMRDVARETDSELVRETMWAKG